jgi:hypothetical protein
MQIEKFNEILLKLTDLVFKFQNSPKVIRIDEDFIVSQPHVIEGYFAVNLQRQIQRNSLNASQLLAQMSLDLWRNSLIENLILDVMHLCESRRCRDAVLILQHERVLALVVSLYAADFQQDFVLVLGDRQSVRVADVVAIVKDCLFGGYRLGSLCRECHSPTNSCAVSHDASRHARRIAVGSARCPNATTVHLPALDDVQACSRLNPAVVILEGNPVQTSILEAHLLDLQIAHVVALLDDVALRGRHDDAVLVPRRPWHRMTRNGALKSHRIALFADTVVRHGVEFGCGEAVALLSIAQVDVVADHREVQRQRRHAACRRRARSRAGRGVGREEVHWARELTTQQIFLLLGHCRNKR